MTFQIISMFNHKGGVSKTTTTFNLAWMLASKGKRVLMVDADPQCNLTGVVLGLNPQWPDEEDVSAPDVVDSDDERSEQFAASQRAAEDFWEENFERTLFGALKPAFDSEPKVLEAVDCVEVDGRPGLYLLPGHLRLGEFEVSLGIAQELAGSMSALRNLPGAIYYLIRETAEKLDADYVIIDMSPSLGALNQNLVSISDQLIVPTSPDFFSIMALQSLGRVLPRWARWAEAASSNEVLREASYPYPAPRLKLAGIVIQRYRLYKKATFDNPYGTPTGPFRAWITKVKEASRAQFAPAMQAAGLTFDRGEYAAAEIDDAMILAQVQEFNSLLPKSQDHRVPVFALTDAQLGQVGVVLDGSHAQIESLKRIFSDMADRIIALPAER
ncbi:ParA family protein [Curtobacterium citreum]|uniref:ParA family protein n=1 Tax=Curtobacterium citreum TaxID=2036 RepID=UPI0027E06C54|nr:AAA family ATPase [Curtobacterium flaccumfaciens]